MRSAFALISNLKFSGVLKNLFSSRGEEAIKELIALLKKNTKKIKGQLLGIGIGIPGVVSSNDSGIANSAMLGWNDVNVGKRISEALNTPVLFENDVNTLAITESLYGHGRDVSNFITITLGRGIGMGLVINGELYVGSNGAGEFGHVNAVNGGVQCECWKIWMSRNNGFESPQSIELPSLQATSQKALQCQSYGISQGKQEDGK